jgi:hypothetical protein
VSSASRTSAPWLLACLLLFPTAAGAVTLGAAGTRFTLDGKPAFLLGASYYGGLAASLEVVSRDLDQLMSAGINWIRVWATWAAFGNDVSAVDTEGRPRPEYLARLQRLVLEADRRGMVVDVSFSRGNGITGPPRLATHAAHLRAVETVVAALQSHRNWYLDLSNERNIRDKRFTSFAELAALRKRVRELAPQLLVTASEGGDISREEVADCLKAGLDFVSPHRPRERGTAEQTAARTREYLTWIQELGRSVPLHYQEPFRRGYADWQPTVDDYLLDLRSARAGGAAGWCFHNGDERQRPDGKPRRCFDLRDGSLIGQLDAVEREVLEKLKAALR